MKFYKRDPDRALAGMAELTLKQRGAYNSLLDLLYSRDGNVPDDDARVARMISCHWREWATIKAELIAIGKVWVEDGLLCAKRVQDTIKEASDFSQEQSKKASSGWAKRKNDNTINDADMPLGNASTPTATPTPTLRKKDSASLLSPRDELRQVLDDEHTGWVIDHRQRLRKPLTGRAAHQLAEKLRQCPDPNAAADLMIEKGWSSMEVGWLARNGSTAPKSNGHAPGKKLEDYTEEDWKGWLDYCRPRGEWAKWLGPPPFTPGCKVPAHLLVDRDRKMTPQVSA